MKLTFSLPILVVNASEDVTSDQRESCSDQVQRLGGQVDLYHRGPSGHIHLMQYPANLRCKQVFKYDEDNFICDRILVNINTVGVPVGPEGECLGDYFWTEVDGSPVTPLQCSIVDAIFVHSDTFTFYFNSDESQGFKVLTLNWRCDTLREPTYITDIGQMSNAVLDGSGTGSFTAADGSNYGCVGRETFNPYATTLGHPVDTADRAFYTWKKCIQCATGNDSDNVEPYLYDQANDSCGKFLKIT